MHYLAELLQQTGLTDREARAYLFLLSDGPQKAPALADHLGLARTSAYPLLDGLVSSGFAAAVETVEGRAYRAEPPALVVAALLSRADEMRQRFERVAEALPETDQFPAKSRSCTKSVCTPSGSGVDAVKTVSFISFAERRISF